MSTTGGPLSRHKDDQRKREILSELHANRATRADEWREPEPPGDDQPEATQVLAGRLGVASGPDPDLLQLRSDLARHLDRATFPADLASLEQTLQRHRAPQPLLDLVATLPGGERWARLTDVLDALGIPAESRRA